MGWQNSKTLYIIIGVLIVVIGGGILWLFPEKSKIDDRDFIDQKGAINPVNNIGEQDREITPQTTQQLITLLPADKNTKITINPIIQDAETLRLADKIKDYLISIGYVNTTRLEGIIQINSPINRGITVSSPGADGLVNIWVK